MDQLDVSKGKSLIFIFTGDIMPKKLDRCVKKVKKKNKKVNAYAVCKSRIKKK